MRAPCLANGACPPVCRSALSAVSLSRFLVRKRLRETEKELNYTCNEYYSMHTVIHDIKPSQLELCITRPSKYFVAATREISRVPFSARSCARLLYRYSGLAHTPDDSQIHRRDTRDFASIRTAVKYPNSSIFIYSYTSSIAQPPARLT